MGTRSAEVLLAGVRGNLLPTRPRPALPSTVTPLQDPHPISLGSAGCPGCGPLCLTQQARVLPDLHPILWDVTGVCMALQLRVPSWWGWGREGGEADGL